MLKSVAVVTGACAARSRKPYPFSSRTLPSLINARAAPGTLCVDMRRSISASEAGNSAADTEAASVTTATAIPTSHIASGRPHQLRFIVLDPIFTIEFRGRTLRGGGRGRQDSGRVQDRAVIVENKLVAAAPSRGVSFCTAIEGFSTCNRSPSPIV